MSAELATASGGHVFIVRSRVQDLTCDAWAISCDGRASPRKEYWLPKWFLNQHPSYDWPRRPTDWGHDYRRIVCVENWPEPKESHP
jgi:hypothetical protein